MTRTIDLTGEVINIKVKRGSPWFLKATIRQRKGGPAMPLTGYTIVGHLSDTPDVSGDQSALVIKRTTEDDANGVFWFGQNAAISTGDYEITLQAPSGSPQPYVSGRLSVHGGVAQT